MNIIEFNVRIKKIIKNIKISFTNIENHENLKIPNDNHENHENHRI